jgi:chromosomal replication initiation ATPase DnaA
MTQLRCSVDAIKHTVMEFYGVDPYDYEYSRSRQATLARHVTWYLIREIKGMSYPQIALRFPNRNPLVTRQTMHHSSVLMGVRNVATRRDLDESFCSELESLRGLLREIAA